MNSKPMENGNFEVRYPYALRDPNITDERLDVIESPPGEMYYCIICGAQMVRSSHGHTIFFRHHDYDDYSEREGEEGRNARDIHNEKGDDIPEPPSTKQLINFGKVPLLIEETYGNWILSAMSTDVEESPDRFEIEGIEGKPYGGCVYFEMEPEDQINVTWPNRNGGTSETIDIDWDQIRLTVNISGGEGTVNVLRHKDPEISGSIFSPVDNAYDGDDKINLGTRIFAPNNLAPPSFKSFIAAPTFPSGRFPLLGLDEDILIPVGVKIMDESKSYVSMRMTTMDDTTTRVITKMNSCGEDITGVFPVSFPQIKEVGDGFPNLRVRYREKKNEHFLSFWSEQNEGLGSPTPSVIEINGKSMTWGSFESVETGELSVEMLDHDGQVINLNEYVGWELDQLTEPCSHFSGTGISTLNQRLITIEPNEYFIKLLEPKGKGRNLITLFNFLFLDSPLPISPRPPIKHEYPTGIPDDIKIRWERISSYEIGGSDLLNGLVEHLKNESKPSKWLNEQFNKNPFWRSAGMKKTVRLTAKWFTSTRRNLV